MSKWSAAAIKRLRRRLGLTQEKFARRLGVTHVTVNRWERHLAEPKGLSVAALDSLEKEK